MQTLLLGLVAVVAIAGTATVLLIQARALRENDADSRRAHLVSECFLHRQESVVDPRRWPVPVPEIRRLAARRGYQEMPPPTAEVLAFRYQPTGDSGPIPPPAPAAEHQARRAELAGQLSTQDFAWVRPAEFGGTLDDVAGLAGRHGARILRVLGDRFDPVLLLGRRPIGSLREAVPLPAAGSRSSAGHHRARIVALVAGVVMVAALIALYVATRRAVVGWTLALAVLALMAAVVVPLVAGSPRRALTERMTRLVQEFDGRDVVTIVLRHVGVDRLVCLDVAAELGYVYSTYHNSLRTTTRWYEGWIVFVRHDRVREAGSGW
ncbi:hypothetical protein SAMN05421810_105287 [Amycolatopsis arida]|uniref:Uncharacterized protein n=1 Tax=Amycolatopsis arida TaxID=587909 RepID=A0A1I5WUJ4_9PSEU|nr:hypothetical protein [Amycolatopsis arida]TDX92461.1 hypothetical protein CLV69_105306 [Amycolatopsis arida]SFQ23442.1 hypothetical protein SAMN05421810_105287 [Amycolatopsis arida]